MLKNMVAAHFTPIELQGLDRLQGGRSYDKQTGLPEYSALESLAHNRQFAEELYKLSQTFKHDPELCVEAGNEMEMVTTSSHTSSAINKIASKGRKGDKELALIPKSLASVLVYAWCEGKPNINSKTGLLEFYSGRDAGGLALGLLSLVIPVFDKRDRGNDPYGYVEAANIQARTAERLAAQARADKEDLLKKQGYYEETKRDIRPWRHKLNPYYNSQTAKAGVPMYIGKEYYDPDTGKSLKSEEAKIKAAERILKHGPELANAGYEYIPDSIEKLEEYYSKPLMDSADSLKKAASFGLDKHSGLKYTNYNIRPKHLEKAELEVVPLKRSVLKKALDSKVESIFKDKKIKKTRSTSGRPLKLLRGHGSDSDSGYYKQGGLVSHKVSCGIKGKGTGQSDDIKVDMPVGSYIIDATTTAHLGDGSSTAGIKALDSMVKTISKNPLRKLIEKRIQIKKIPVAVANEEYKIDPITVSTIGGGDLNKGSKMLERMVKRVRQHKAQGGLNLPPQAYKPLDYLKV